jgi:hypothetical protein
MKQVLISRTEHSGSRLCETRVARRAQVPPGDLADCLLVAYQGVSQRAFRLNQFRRAEPGSELKNWKNAEHDLLPRIFMRSRAFRDTRQRKSAWQGRIAGCRSRDMVIVPSKQNWVRTMRNSMTAREHVTAQKPACDECDSQCNLEAGQSFQYWWCAGRSGWWS